MILVSVFSSVLAISVASTVTDSLYNPVCAIKNYGIFKEGRLIRTEKHDATLHGRVYVYSSNSESKVAKKVDSIPAKKGVDFGVEHTFSGISDSTKLWIILKHPEMRKPDGKIINVQKAIKSPASDASSYKLSHEYEIVTGKWVFEFWYDDDLLCSKSFELYDPNEP